MIPRHALLLPLLLAHSPPAGAQETISGTVTPSRATPPIVVYVESVKGGTTTTTHLKIEQINSRFSPDVLVVLKGQSVEFPNRDKHYHNVFSNSPGNEFDLGLYRGGVSKTTRFDKSGEVDVYCNIHEQMAARVLVLQNPLFAQAEGDGGYRIVGVPEGVYTLVAWSMSHEPERRSVRVRAGLPLRVDFALKRRRPTEAHENKSGEHYGRYQ